MKNWEIVIGFIALATGIWGQIKSVLAWFKSFIIKTQWVENRTSKLVVAYLTSDGTGWGARSARERVYGSGKFFVRPVGQSQHVPFEHMAIGDSVLWYKKRPIWFVNHDKGLGNYECNIEQTMSFIRGTIDFEKLLIEATEWASEVKGSNVDELGYVKSRHKIVYHHGKTLGGEIARQRDAENGAGRTAPKVTFGWDVSEAQRLLKWRPEDLGGAVGQARFDAMALTDDLKKVVERVKLWRKSEKWYQARGIPWRMGMLFDGLPGTGKTSMVRAAGEELDLPVHIFDLATMSNEDLCDAWSEMASDAPCVALIEDIDAVFEGRKNITKAGGMMSSGGLTFDALLNRIDGIERHDGVLLVVTTNHPDKIDPALAKRGGRIDFTVTFKALDFAQRLHVAKNILGDTPEAAKLAMESPDTPAGSFVEICCRAALTNLYANANSEKKDPYR